MKAASANLFNGIILLAAGIYGYFLILTPEGTRAPTALIPAAFGILFLIFGVFKSKLSFHFYPDKFGITGIILILFALIGYPVLGYFLGHVYPSSPTFGLPCPTTIFTFGLLLLSAKKCPVIILIVPFIWSIIGFLAAFQFGIVEDTGLLISGLITFSLLLFKNRSLFTMK